MEMWHCDICKKTIQEKGRPGHLRSKRHLANVAIINQNKEAEEAKNTVTEDTEEPEEGSKIIDVDKKGESKKKDKKEKTGAGEIKIRIIDGSETEQETKPDALDRIMDFAQDPKNQPIISMLGSLLQNLMAAKHPTAEKQTAKWGFDRDTGEEIDF